MCCGSNRRQLKLICLVVLFLGFTLLRPQGSSEEIQKTEEDNWSVNPIRYYYDEFPLSWERWESIGWLVHYDWGIAGYAFSDGLYIYYGIHGASATHSVYISTNASDNHGYLISGICAQYALCEHAPANGYYTGGDGGLFRWNSTGRNWMPLFIANEDLDGSNFAHGSAGGEVQVCPAQGRVALSALGNPDKMLIVFEAMGGGVIRIPHNGFAFIDVEHEFGVSFVAQKPMSDIPHPVTEYPTEPQEWVVNLTETVNVSLSMINYGPRSIDVSARLDLPSGINVTEGSGTWNFSIDSSERRFVSAVVDGDSFGIYELGLLLTCGGNEPAKLMQKVAIVPQIETRIEAPTNASYSQQCEINLTAKNLDPVPAKITLLPAFGAAGSPISLTLAASSELTIQPIVRVYYGTIIYDTLFQGVQIAKSSATVKVSYPQHMWDEGILVGSAPYYSGEYVVMNDTQTYEVQMVLHNANEFPFTFTVKPETDEGKPIATSEYFIVEPSSTSITLAPDSSGTVVFLIVALKADEVTYRELAFSFEVEGYRCGYSSIEFMYVPLTDSWYDGFLKTETIVTGAMAFIIGMLFAAVLLRLHVRCRNRKVTGLDSYPTPNP